MKKKKEMIPLTHEGNKSYHKQKVCYICKKEFNTDTIKSEIIVITLEDIDELLIIFAIEDAKHQNKFL